VIPFSPAATTAPAGDPQMLLSVLTGISLSQLMNLSVYSGLGLLQELDVLHADGAPTNPAATEFLHNMLSLAMPALISVGPLHNLFLRVHAERPGYFDFVGNLDPPAPAGALPSGEPAASDHHPEQPTTGDDHFVVQPPPALFTGGSDTVI